MGIGVDGVVVVGVGVWDGVVVGAAAVVHELSKRAHKMKRMKNLILFILFFWASFLIIPIVRMAGRGFSHRHLS